MDIQRSGKVHIQVFEISEYGSEEAALLAAERVRNQWVLKMPLSFSYEHRQRLMPHNTSGHPGFIGSNQTTSSTGERPRVFMATT